jgi:hypothetical protein
MRMDAWAILSKGSRVMVSAGHGTIIVQVLDDFEKWKGHVLRENSFEACFTEYHDMLALAVDRVDIPFTAGKIPK